MNKSIITNISFPSLPTGAYRDNILSVYSVIESWDMLSFYSIEKWASSKTPNQGPISINPYLLRHRLSSEMMGERVISLTTRHSVSQEIKVSNLVKDSFQLSTRSGTLSLFKLLKFIHLLICPLSPRKFRSSRSVSGKNPWLSDYGYIEYTNYSQIHSYLHKVWKYWMTYSSNEKPEIRLQAAIVLYCNILSIHPFSDGNGRVARIILNCALSYIFKRDIFFPESSLALISEYGFLLCKREAQILKLWTPLIQLFCTSIRQITRLRSFVWVNPIRNDVSFKKKLYNEAHWSKPSAYV